MHVPVGMVSTGTHPEMNVMPNPKKKKSSRNGRLHKIKDCAMDLAPAALPVLAVSNDPEDVGKYCIDVATAIIDYEEPDDVD